MPAHNKVIKSDEITYKPDSDLSPGCGVALRSLCMRASYRYGSAYLIKLRNLPDIINIEYPGKPRGIPRIGRLRQKEISQADQHGVLPLGNMPDPATGPDYPVAFFTRSRVCLNKIPPGGPTRPATAAGLRFL